MTQPNPSRILIVSVSNDRYPITPEVIHRISTDAVTDCGGCVNKIVILRTHGIKAFVEFDRAESAALAAEYLDNADIYQDCCTLSIKSAEPGTLDVPQNTKDRRDYKSSHAESLRFSDVVGSPRETGVCEQLNSGAKRVADDGDDSTPTAKRHLTVTPPVQSSDFAPDDGERHVKLEPYEPDYNQEIVPSICSTSSSPPEPSPRGPTIATTSLDVAQCSAKKIEVLGRNTIPRQREKGRTSSSDSTRSSIKREGRVLSFLNLNGRRINCDRLFNLCCLFGTVRRVAFRDENGHRALVEMSQPKEAANACKHLMGVELFDRSLSVMVNTMSQVYQDRNVGMLGGKTPRLTPSFADYTRVPRPRFVPPAAAQELIVLHPCRTLLFYICAPDHIGQTIEQILSDVRFPFGLAIGSKTTGNITTGFMEFSTTCDALDTLTLLNNDTSLIRGRRWYVWLAFVQRPAVDDFDALVDNDTRNALRDFLR